MQLVNDIGIIEEKKLWGKESNNGYMHVKKQWRCWRIVWKKLQNMQRNEGQHWCHKKKKFIVVMARGHGMACMAQKYHGDKDVDGPFCKNRQECYLVNPWTWVVSTWAPIGEPQRIFLEISYWHWWNVFWHLGWNIWWHGGIFFHMAMDEQYFWMKNKMDELL